MMLELELVQEWELESELESESGWELEQELPGSD